MSEEKTIKLEPVGITVPFELTEYGAQWLAALCGGRTRTFRHPDGKYEHTVSAVDPKLNEWPEELEVNEETQNHQ